MKKIERFDKYMSYVGLNDNKVTLDLGISVGTIGKSRADDRDLSDKVVEKILNFYTDINEVWLKTGKGEMLQDNSQKTVDRTNNRNIDTLEKSRQRSFDVLVDELRRFHELNIKKDEYIKSQDEYIACIIKNSYERNERHMDRIDKLISIIDKGRQETRDMIERMVSMLEKKI